MKRRKVFGVLASRLGWPVRRSARSGRFGCPRRSSTLGIQQLESRIAFAVTPSLVADLNATPRSGAGYNSMLGGFGPTANGFVFLLDDAIHGQELWVTDGTAAGTSLLEDINPTGSVELWSSSPLFNGAYYFLPVVGSSSGGLWKTDGTTSGTVLVKNLGGYGIDHRFFVFDGKLFFGADGSLWQSDGTTAGTTTVSLPVQSIESLSMFVLGDNLFVLAGNADGTSLLRIVPGSTEPPALVASLSGAFVSGGITVGGRYVFPANQAGEASLWSTDGTSSGTTMLMGSGAAPEGAEFSEAATLGGVAYFSAATGTAGNELWRTDGTVNGTQLVKDINPGGDGSFPRDLTRVSNTLFFSATDASNGTELWATDGTAGGTRLVTDLNPGTVGGEPRGSFPNALTAFGTQLYFSANGNKLYRTDGTSAGTTLVKNINPNEDPAAAGSSGFGAMAVFNGRLFFPADDGVHGREVWASDGSEAGTSLFKDVVPGTDDGLGYGSTSYVAGATLNGMFLFAGDDGATGMELRARDASGQVRLVKDVAAAEGGYNPSSSPDEFFRTGSTVYFSASPDPFSRIRTVWKTDGTTSGTVPLGSVAAAPPSPEEYPGLFRFTEYGGYVFFCADTENSRGLYRTDGTDQGTVLVADDFDVWGTAVVNGHLYLIRRSQTPSIFVLSTATGTPTATAILGNGELTYPSKLTAFNGRLYFSATPAASTSGQSRLYSTNGSSVATPIQAESGGFPSPEDLRVAGTKLFFTASTPETGSELWTLGIVNGVERATLVADVVPGADGADFAGGMVAYGNTVFLLRYDVAASRYRLWQSDGTTAGTLPVAFAGSEAPEIEMLSSPVAGAMFVAAKDQARGLELWSLALESAAAPGSPTAVVGTPANASVRLEWVAPSFTGGSPILNYVIEYSRNGGQTWTLHDGVPTGTSATVTGLENGVAYVFRVAARNQSGTGVPSVVSAAVTPRTTPSAPSAVATTAGDGQFRLQWNPPSSNGGATISGYTIQYSINGGATWIAYPSQGAATSTLLTGLVAGRTYVYRVAAVNQAGQGAFSPVSARSVFMTVPAAPERLSGVAGNGQVVLRWTPPRADGAARITDYVVQFSADGGGSWATFADPVSATPSAVVNGLANGTPYLFRVAARNAVGTGSFSASPIAVTPRTIPGQPVDVTATAGIGQIGLQWTAPASNGGAPIGDYRLEFSLNGGRWRVLADATSTATSMTIRGLAVGGSYRFRVAAVNAVGASAFSDPSAAVVFRTLPGLPTAVIGTPGVGLATLRWRAPRDTGGAAIIDYTIQYRLEESVSWTTVERPASGALTAVVPGLTNGRTYLFRVAARTEVGTGVFSAVSSRVRLPLA